MRLAPSFIGRPPNTRARPVSTVSLAPSACAAAGAAVSATPPPAAAATPSTPSAPSTSRRLTLIVELLRIRIIPQLDVGGPEMAPHSPHAPRPGGAVALRGR